MNEKNALKFPQYKTVSVDKLVPYARNSRTHSDKQVAQIAASINEFGFLNPVIVDGENGIIAGHGRVMAAQKLGMDELPTVEAAHLSETQKRAYIIADNKLALNAGWDDELLRVEFDDLQSEGFDLELTGFSFEEQHKILGDGLAELGGKEEFYDSVFEVAVTCQDEADQQRVYSIMTERGYKCRVLSM